MADDAELDPVLLAYERDEAWRLMQHYMGIAERAEASLRSETQHRFRMMIKANALDEIFRLTHFGRPTVEAIKGIASKALKDHNSLYDEQKKRNNKTS